MPESILAELIQSSADSLRQTLRRREPEGFTPREAEAVISLAIDGLQHCRRLWDELRDRLAESGREGGALRLDCAGVIGAARTYLSVMEAARRIALRTASRHQAPVTGLPELDKAFREVAALQGRAAELLAWSNAAPRLDEQMVAESRASHARGESEDLEEIVARIRAGGAV
jgi:hypothetical protein